jgi:SOS-response transcriptional repressor LexA
MMRGRKPKKITDERVKEVLLKALDERYQQSEIDSEYHFCLFGAYVGLLYYNEL